MIIRFNWRNGFCTRSQNFGFCGDWIRTQRRPQTATRIVTENQVMFSRGQYVVRVKDADLVLDNLNDDIQLAATTHVQGD